MDEWIVDDLLVSLGIDFKEDQQGRIDGAGGSVEVMCQGTSIYGIITLSQSAGRGFDDSPSKDDPLRSGQTDPIAAGKRVAVAADAAGSLDVLQVSVSAAMAQFVASFSHDISQPIHVVQNAFSIFELRRDAGTLTPETTQTCLSMLDSGVEKLNASLRLMKNTVHEWSTDFRDIDLVSTLYQVVGEVAAAKMATITLESIDPQVIVRADVAQLRGLIASVVWLMDRNRTDSNTEARLRVSMEQSSDRAIIRISASQGFHLPNALLSEHPQGPLSSGLWESALAIASANDIQLETIPAPHRASDEAADSVAACTGVTLGVPLATNDQPPSEHRRLARRLWS
ncbi:hypothetical protein [Rubripirellula lacrimiformis]|nr:hypothetical protein [Rubripirellula lacrimiformis]